LGTSLDQNDLVMEVFIEPEEVTIEDAFEGGNCIMQGARSVPVSPIPTPKEYFASEKSASEISVPKATVVGMQEFLTSENSPSEISARAATVIKNEVIDRETRGEEIDVQVLTLHLRRIEEEFRLKIESLQNDLLQSLQVGAERANELRDSERHASESTEVQQKLAERDLEYRQCIANLEENHKSTVFTLREQLLLSEHAGRCTGEKLEGEREWFAQEQAERKKEFEDLASRTRTLQAERDCLEKEATHQRTERDKDLKAYEEELKKLLSRREIEASGFIPIRRKSGSLVKDRCLKEKRVEKECLKEEHSKEKRVEKECLKEEHSKEKDGDSTADTEVEADPMPETETFPPCQLSYQVSSAFDRIGIT